MIFDGHWAKIVRRLTSEPAEFFGLKDIGKLEVGAQADLGMIDPEALREWDDCSNREFVYRELFEHKQLLSRSNGVVTHTFINGETAWRNGEFGEALGTKTLGRALRAA